MKSFVLGVIFVVSLVSRANGSAPVHITSFANIIEPLMPSVVNIYTVKHTKHIDPRSASIHEMLPFEQFNNFLERFNVPFSFEELYNNPSAMALGSGFIVDADGHVMTNYHVINDSDEIYVKFSDNTEMPAKIVGIDPKTDLALLKIDAKKKLPFVTFADSSNARVGDVVIAIGNPLGFGGTVTTGIISSKGRDLGMNPDELVDDFIQTDAAINTGNSGGPLFNIMGKVLGMNTAIPEAGGGTNIGIGFAIPSATVQDIMKQLKEKGKISRGRLEVNIQEVTKELAEALSLSKIYGVLITDVRPGGTGDKAGLKRGDLIIEFNGEMVLNARKLQLFVADSHIGENVNLTVIRNNKQINLVAKIIEFKKPSELVKIRSEETSLIKSGVILSNLTLNLINKFGLSEKNKGIVVIELSQQGQGLDFKVGDLIIAIDQQHISDIKQFETIYDKMKSNNKKNAVLLVKRRGFTMFVAIPIK